MTTDTFTYNLGISMSLSFSKLEWESLLIQMSRDQYHICPSGKWNLASPRSCVTTFYTILLRAASESEPDINIFQGHKPHVAMRLFEVASKLRNKINNSLIMLHDFVLRQVANHVKNIGTTVKGILYWKVIKHQPIWFIL